MPPLLRAAVNVKLGVEKNENKVNVIVVAPVFGVRPDDETKKLLLLTVKSDG